MTFTSSTTGEYDYEAGIRFSVRTKNRLALFTVERDLTYDDAINMLLDTYYVISAQEAVEAVDVVKIARTVDHLGEAEQAQDDCIQDLYQRMDKVSADVAALRKLT